MKNKKIIIRADGNARIGAGHLMRCLTIADAFEEKDSVGFLCADEDSAVLIRDKGYTAWVLHSDYTDMESEWSAWKSLFSRNIQEQENRKTTEIVKGDKPDSIDWVILVDSYYVTNAYLTKLKKFGKVVILDDMAKIPWNADIVINYNAFANQEMYRALQSPYMTQYYTGGSYIPVRKEFCGRNYSVRENVENILITTGGGDCDNIAGQILECIRSESCHYHVVTGRFNPHYDTLLGLTTKHSNIHIYHDVKDMAHLMEQCDLAVTAGGTTIYELSAIGVPFVCFAYAENQEKLTEYIGENRIAGYGGAFHKEPEHTLAAIRAQINDLARDFELRQRYSRAEQELVDGQGAARIAEVLSGLR